MVSLKEY